jgi:hypothetical protein
MNLHRARVLVLVGMVIASGVGGGVAAWAADGGNDQSLTRGFFAFPGGDGWVTVNLGTEFTDLQRLTLPPGKYIATATAALASNILTSVGCRLTIGTLEGDFVQGVLGRDSNDFLALPLTFGFTIQTPQDLAVACVAGSAGAVVSQPSPITAIPVDRLTIQEGFAP